MVFHLFHPYLHIAVDPWQNTADFSVNARLVSLTTASSPAGDAHQVPKAVSLAHQRSTTVTLKNTVHTQLMQVQL